MCTRSPDVDGINIFDKDDQAAKHYSIKEQCFAAWSSLSKILIPSTSGDLVEKISGKNFKPIALVVQSVGVTKLENNVTNNL